MDLVSGDGDNGPMPKGKRWRRTFIREWRAHRGIDQARLAEAMGISVPYLSQLESGNRRYNQDMLESAADALDTSVAHILSRRPPPDNSQPLEESESDQIASMWEQLAPRDRGRAASFMRGLKDTE